MGDRVDVMFLEIGYAGALNRQNLRVAIRHTKTIIARMSPLTAIDIAIGGYDDDPREIYQIPEARQFLIGFAAGLLDAGIPLERMLPSAVDVIRCCLATEQGIEVVTVDGDIDISKDLREYQDKVRRSMQ